VVLARQLAFQVLMGQIHYVLVKLRLVVVEAVRQAHQAAMEEMAVVAVV
jgi:hypothetical protein